MVKLLFWLPGELAKQFRSKSAETMIRFLGGDLTLIDKIKTIDQVVIKDLVEVDEEIVKVEVGDVKVDDVKVDEVREFNQLTFSGIFQGRESEIRITSNKMISVFDFIKVVGGQIHPRKVWERILNEHKDELGIVSFCHYAQFGKTKSTPVINVQEMVKLLFWLPGELAKQFRSKSAETMIRFLGGDLTLIDEIKTIDQLHIVTLLKYLETKLLNHFKFKVYLIKIK